MENIIRRSTARPVYTIGAFPNPFNLSGAITAPAGAEVEIYDIRGNVVTPCSADKSASLVSLNKGNNKIAEQSSRGIIWQPDESIPSEIYLVKCLSRRFGTRMSKPIRIEGIPQYTAGVRIKAF